VLGQSASEAGLYIMYFFIGFAVSTQIGGRILDKIGARPTIIVGSIIGAIGFYLWASKMTDFSVNDQIWSIIIAGFGMGLILGPANTDAINRAPAESYAEATGITQTVRNYGAALGMAILGTILITQNRVNIEDNLGQIGIPKAQADQIASAVASGAQNAGTTGGAQAAEIFKGIQTSYAQSTQTIFYVMSGVLALIFIYSLIFVPRGKVDEIVADGTYDTDADSAASS
jgi:fucose permease